MPQRRRPAGVDLAELSGLLVPDAAQHLAAEPLGAPLDIELHEFATSELYSDLRGAIGVAVQG